MLEVRGLNAWWGGAQALFDVSLQVGAGELVVLQGLNGAGKSTLLQAIMGVGPNVTGEVCYQIGSNTDLPAPELADITRWLPYRRAQAGLGYVAEDRRLFHALTVRDNLHIAARGDERAMEARVMALFPALGGMLDRRATEMSGGEQQMLAIARTLMGAPRLLLLDEPCEGIAPVLVESIRDALLALRAEGLPMLVAEQNNILASRANRCLRLVAGRLDGMTAVPQSAA